LKRVSFRARDFSEPLGAPRSGTKQKRTLQEPSIAGSSILLSQTSGVNSDELRLSLFLQNVEVRLEDDVGWFQRGILVEETEIDDEMGEESKKRRVEALANEEKKHRQFGEGRKRERQVRTHSGETTSLIPSRELAN